MNLPKKNQPRVVSWSVGLEDRSWKLFSTDASPRRSYTTARKAAVLMTVLLLGVVLGYVTVRNFAIETLLEKSPSSNNLLALHHMAPNNAYINAAMGRLYQYSASDFKLTKAVDHYRKALAVNPYDVSTWQNLAKAYESLGEISNAKQALEDATLASRSSAAVYWTNANFLIRNDPSDTDSLLSSLKRIIELDPNSLVPALKLASQAGIDLQRAYHSIVPFDVSSQITTINYFFTIKDWLAASLAWNTLCHSGQVFNIEQALPYIDALIANDRLSEAQNAWFEALTVTHYLEATAGRPALELGNWSPSFGSGIQLKPEGRGALAFAADRAPVTAASMNREASGNLIFNPDFRRDPLNGGFDWRVSNSLDTIAWIDKEVFLKNRQSLLVEFDGKSNLDFANVYQFVPVRPSTHYDFTAWLKTEALSTDRGVFFEVFEVSNSKTSVRPWRTVESLGTTDWTGGSTQFTTGPETRLLQVRLRRLPSSKIDNLIRGRVWIGSVSLNEKSM